MRWKPYVSFCNFCFNLYNCVSQWSVKNWSWTAVNGRSHSYTFLFTTTNHAVRYCDTDDVLHRLRHQSVLFPEQGKPQLPMLEFANSFFTVWVSAPLSHITHPIYIIATRVTRVVCNHSNPATETKANWEAHVVAPAGDSASGSS